MEFTAQERFDGAFLVMITIITQLAGFIVLSIADVFLHYNLHSARSALLSLLALVVGILVMLILYLPSKHFVEFCERHHKRRHPEPTQIEITNDYQTKEAC